MRVHVIVAAMLLCGTAHAQYKCTVGGKSIYSDQPCARDAQNVGVAHDRVPPQRAAEARARAAKEGDEVARIKEAELRAEERRQRMAAERRNAAPPPVDKCAEARKDLARLREPMITHIWGYPVDASGRQQNERQSLINEAERRVFHACK